MAGGEGGGVADGEGLERFIVAVGAGEAGAGGLVEGDAEFHLRDGVDDRLINVLYGLDEVGLAEDEIAAFGDLERHEFQLHGSNVAQSYTLVVNSMRLRILAMALLGAMCLHGESLRIMTFNVRYPAKGDGPNVWEARRDLMVATIREKNPDVFGTQELFYEQGQYSWRRRRSTNGSASAGAATKPTSTWACSTSPPC